MAPKVFRLNCQPQPYAWGKIGSSSKVAEYAASTPGFQIDEKKPYAELWMGTHPNAPSKVFESGEDLGSLLKNNPDLIDPQILQAYGDLPFLLKVLSVNLALSIQAHPTKELAKELFARHPDIYKDPNHKPEMAIALTPFEALCGFRPVAEISGFLATYPEFRQVIGEQVAESFIAAAGKEGAEEEKRAALKALFNVLMRAEVGVVGEQLEKLVARISEMSGEEQKKGVNELVKRLNEQFPKDVGCFCAFVLNFMILKPGEAIFLAANLPHAYISGDCVECMATSDNVVRAGLTPKLRDVDTLVSMLDYTYGPSSEFLLQSSPLSASSPSSTLYRAPVPEFSVLRTNLASNQSEAFEGLKGPSVLIVTSGKGKIGFEGEEKELSPGFVYFVAAGEKVTVSALEGGIDCYRAFCDRLP